MADDKQYFEIPELIVHGSKVNTRYGVAVPNYQTYFGYSVNAVEFGDDQATSSAIMRLIMQDPTITDVKPGHATGNPVFCAYLKLSTFSRSHQGSIQFTIEDLHLLASPMPGIWDWGAHPQGGWLNINRQPCSFHYQRRTQTGPGLYPGPGVAVMGAYFAPFSFRYALYVGTEDNIGTNVQGGVLFSKPGYSTTAWDKLHWDNGVYGCRDVKISAQSLNPEDHVIFAIFMDATCNCNRGNAGKPWPVYAVDLAPYFPPADPYVWRMCEDNKWHLIRPFYFMNKEGSTKQWTSVESDQEGN